MVNYYTMQGKARGFLFYFLTVLIFAKLMAFSFGYYLEKAELH